MRCRDTDALQDRLKVIDGYTLDAGLILIHSDHPVPAKVHDPESRRKQDGDLLTALVEHLPFPMFVAPRTEDSRPNLIFGVDKQAAESR